MKSRDAGTTITTNDEFVRLRIFDGVIPADGYHREMAEIARKQHEAARREFIQVRSELETMVGELKVALGKAIDYCDAATHCDNQYADERSEFIRVWRELNKI